MKTLVKNSIPSILDELFNDRFVNNQWLSQAPLNRFSKAAFNVKDKETSYVIDIAAPGLTKSDFKISLEKNLLTISSEKKMSEEEKNERYTYREFSYFNFSKNFTLPEDADTESIEAKYDAGILSVTVPKKLKTENQQIKTIEIV